MERVSGTRSTEVVVINSSLCDVTERHEHSLMDWLQRFNGDVVISVRDGRLKTDGCPYLWLFASILNATAYASLTDREPRHIYFPDDARVLSIVRNEQDVALRLVYNSPDQLIGSVHVPLDDLVVFVEAIEMALEGISLEGTNSAIFEDGWFLEGMSLDPQRRCLVAGLGLR